MRVVSFLLLLALAIFAPLVASGYSELKQATRAGNYVEAAQHYRTAAQRLPWRADLYELAGHAYYHARDYSQASALYRKADERHALSADGWVAWGDVLYLNKDPEQATRIWEQGLEQPRPSENLYSRLAQVYKENGNYAQAAGYLKRYASLHPRDASAHYRLGLLLTLTDQNTALSELITASQLDPQLDPTVQTLRSALNQASISASPSARYVLIGRGLGLVQEWELARAAFDSAVEADDRNAEAWAWLAEAKHQTGREGGTEIDRAFLVNPNSATVRGLRGLYFERSGNFRAALVEFQTAARLDPQNPAWQVSIGEAYSKLGDLIRALDAYQAATKIAPEEAGYWRLLALFCAQNNANIRAVGIPAAERAVALGKNDAASLDLLGWLFFLDKRYMESETRLKQALDVDPQNVSAHLHMAMLYLQTGKREAAYDHLVAARDLGSQDAETILKQYFP